MGIVLCDVGEMCSMTEQPLPTPGQASVTQALIAELQAREQKGIETYGRSLETFNGRDALRDALEEALDLSQYLKQALMEREAGAAQATADSAAPAGTCAHIGCWSQAELDGLCLVCHGGNCKLRCGPEPQRRPPFVAEVAQAVEQFGDCQRDLLQLAELVLTQAPAGPLALWAAWPEVQRAAQAAKARWGG